MSEKQKVFKNDIGTEIKVYIDDTTILPADISSSYFVVKKPSGIIVQWNTIANSDVNGTYISYITQAGDLDEYGLYKLQPYFDFTTWKGRGDVITLQVEEIVEEL